MIADKSDVEEQEALDSKDEEAKQEAIHHVELR